MKQKDWTQFQNKSLIPFYRDELDVRYCENCGSTFGLSFHHLVRRSRGGTNNISNIMLLCQKCHHEADNGHNNVEFSRMLIERAKYRYWVDPKYFDNIRT